jgi:glycosyltransferase involved in cell wall biosynthesis
LIGLNFKKKTGVKFIFDMRDFWPDSNKEIRRFDVDKKRLDREVYSYFKKKEKEFIETADHIVSLTEAGKLVMQQWNTEGLVQLNVPVSVIPCCADFAVFDRSQLNEERFGMFRSLFEIKPTDFVINYLGSLGPTYMTDQMMDFFSVLLEKKPDAKFLIIANNDHQLAIAAAKRKNIDLSKIIVTKGAKEDVPYLIAMSHLSIFFVIPTFAKQACSPTKLGELLAMNVPVISNSKIGDLDTILDPQKNNSITIKDFTHEEYDRALNVLLPAIERNSNHIRENSTYFSLTRGVELYNHIYESLENHLEIRYKK